MNLEEIRGFCSARGIPYKIVAEYPNGKVKCVIRSIAIAESGRT